jgi:glycosyltransferase involved in cell wall biosynthesis
MALSSQLQAAPYNRDMLDPAIDSRPGLAFVVNSITPYGVNLYRSIAAGIPELKLHVLLTHWAADFKWQVDLSPEFHLEQFCHEGENPLENPLRHPLYDWQKGGRLIRHVRDNNIQAVIIIGYRFLSLLRLMNYCYTSNVPFFVNQDSNIRSEPQLSVTEKFIKRQMYAWWIKRVSGVFSMGKLGDQFFVKYGATPEQIYRVPCWPDFDVFARVDQNRLDQFRQRFGLIGRRHYLLYAGRLVPQKRVDLLIDTFAAIADSRPDWDLLVVGDGVLRDELQRRVPERFRSRVIWTGFLDRDEPALAYHAADVLVLPSDHEPWALVVQEAMAAGLVVVSSDVPGATFELVEDKRSGRVFPAGDLEQLKQSILEVTEADALPTYKKESYAAFANWRNKNNPIAEIRRALSDNGLLKPVSSR